VTSAIYYAVFAATVAIVLAMISAVNLQVCGWGLIALALAIGFMLGSVFGLALSRLMSSMIIMTEANAYGKRRIRERERNLRHGNPKP
jgi:hypothetical protein